MAWRLAKSLVTLRDQINEAYPARRKSSDGTIGDAAHSSRASDHNPNKDGVVTAIDLTHDPERGFSAGMLAEALRAERNARLKYVIFGRRIFYGDYKSYLAWKWQPYHGANPHTQHIHISAKSDRPLYDDGKPWQLGLGAPLPERNTDPSLRLKIARAIYEREVRRKAGVPVIYIPSDGSHEFAGINDRHHPREFSKITAFLNAGHHKAAEDAAVDYIARYTDPAADWHADSRVDAYLRDTFYHRGPTGAARILQRAVVVDDDGVIGPETREAVKKATVDNLLIALRKAREIYERTELKRDESDPSWTGLVNRWNQMLAFSKSMK